MEFIPPGHDLDGLLLAQSVGDILPGWRLGISPSTPGLLEAATDRRTHAYTWTVALLVISLIMLASLAWGLVRRQLALTRLRNDLVANVTHELKTPIASTRLLVETLLNAPQFNEQTTREYLQLIATENLRLSRLIGNFLTFSRIERSKYTFDFKPVTAAAIAHGAVTAVRDRMQAPGCSFDVAVAPDLPPITADADALVTALVNLLDNAWKYTGESKEIVLAARADAMGVAFAVRDNGVGLALQDTKRIFRRFVQVQPAQPNGGGGAGLGLSIVQFIVDAHHGTVSVESEPGCGSTFTITLPAAGNKPA
jgi:signal transduction histidine kinase